MLLQTKKLSVSTADHQIILKNLSISIKKKEITILMGESGSGKTTLGKTFSALLPDGFYISGGEILIEDRITDYNDLKKLRGNTIFYTPQDAASSLNPLVKIKGQINEVSKISKNELCSLLANLNFANPEKILNSYPFHLSGGENQRCLLAMAVAMKPKLLILDEPTSSLDHEFQLEFAELVNLVQKQYDLTILLITHNIFLSRELSGTVFNLSNGSILNEEKNGDFSPGVKSSNFIYSNFVYSKGRIQSES